MEGFDVVSNDEKKVGHVVGTHNGFLIIESGMLRKTTHAVPLDTTRTDDAVVRLTLSKEMVEESPPVDEESDWQRIADYYGRPADQEGQSAGVDPAAVGIHQDRWEVKE